MNTFEQILNYLDGKKTYIAAIALLVIPFLVSQGFITQELGALIAGIIAILMGGGKYVTDKAIENSTNLGIAISQKRIK